MTTISQINLHNKNTVNAVPTGTVLICCCYKNNKPVVPDGYLLCDGSTYTEEQYPNLYKYTGSTDGTFTVPDARECIFIGVGTSDRDDIGDHDEYKLGEFKDDQIETHSHRYISTSNKKTQFCNNNRTSNAPLTSYGSKKTSAINASNIPDDYKFPRVKSVTRNKRIGVNFIIKY